MFIIRDLAENKLTEALESFRSEAGTARCVHFRLAGKPVPQALPELLIKSVELNLSSSLPQIYFCEDGDIFILAPKLSGKEYHQIVAALIAELHIPSLEQWADIYELNIHLSRLLVIVKQKLEKLHKQQQQQLTRKRHPISSTPTTASRNIVNRRNSRDTTEIMVIEEDIVSLLLVDKTLLEQYRLTGIGSLDRALNTYARLSPNLVFLDINLAYCSSQKLLESIIALDREAHVVVLSGANDQGNIMQAMSHGAKGFITKPYTHKKLLQYIQRHLIQR